MKEIPSPPHNCSLVNKTAHSLTVECMPGYSGGLEQIFFLQVYTLDPNRLLKNVSNQQSPYFSIDNLPAGFVFKLIIYATNRKGQSKSIEITCSTSEPSPWKSADIEPNDLGSIVIPILLILALIIIIVIFLSSILIHRNRIKGRMRTSASSTTPTTKTSSTASFVVQSFKDDAGDHHQHYQHQHQHHLHKPSNITPKSIMKKRKNSEIFNENNTSNREEEADDYYSYHHNHSETSNESHKMIINSTLGRGVDGPRVIIDDENGKIDSNAFIDINNSLRAIETVDDDDDSVNLHRHNFHHHHHNHSDLVETLEMTDSNMLNTDYGPQLHQQYPIRLEQLHPKIFTNPSGFQETTTTTISSSETSNSNLIGTDSSQATLTTALCFQSPLSSKNCGPSSSSSSLSTAAAATAALTSPTLLLNTSINDPSVENGNQQTMEPYLLQSSSGFLLNGENLSVAPDYHLQMHQLTSNILDHQNLLPSSSSSSSSTSRTATAMNHLLQLGPLFENNDQSVMKTFAQLVIPTTATSTTNVPTALPLSKQSLSKVRIIPKNRIEISSLTNSFDPESKINFITSNELND
ncbi:cytosolic purine 5'-nucleotidase [Sarcoptes scabiei]|nr:cytosolic purine 5'-nucleotidase [Sarcoptes scabiei]